MPGAKRKTTAKCTVAAYGQPSEAFTRLWNEGPAFAEPTVAPVVTKKRKNMSTPRSGLSRDHRRGEFEGVPAAYKGLSPASG